MGSARQALLAGGQSAPKQRRRPGWHYTIIGGIAAMGFSLLCNIIMLIVGLTRYNPQSGRGQLAIGSCSMTPTIDTGLHIGINILSALLLGASNAAMQCVSAPSRADLDTIHAKGGTADIGISGFRNLRFMSPLRRTVWAVLLVSSLPLHLLYNSVVVSTVTSFEWRGYVVSPDFTQGAAWNRTETNYAGVSSEKLTDLQNLAGAGALQRMEPSECIQTFTNIYTAEYPSMLMISATSRNRPSSSGVVLGYFISSIDNEGASYLNLTTYGEKDSAASGEDSFSTSYWPFFWQPLPRDDSVLHIPQGQNPPPDIDFSGIDHCLAERVDNLCTVDTLPTLQALVVAFNMVKLACLLVILFKLPMQPLITIGDAIASYLTQPDEVTYQGDNGEISKSTKNREIAPLSTEWRTSPKQHRWFRGVSRARWTTTSMICIGYWTAGLVGVLLISTDNPVDNYGTIISGFSKGSVSNSDFQFGGQYETASEVAQTIQAIVLANSFQILLSIAYFQYNGVVTSMVLSREFTNFARNRKGLRVSDPSGAERRTFWLSLPYTYSAPLLVLAGLLHWLLSEAVFYQEVATVDGDEVFSTSAPGSLLTTDRGTYLSVEPLFVLVIFAAFCMLLVVGLGFRRYAGGIPIVGSNSRAISAACQPSKVGAAANVLEPIQWGVRGLKPAGDADLGFSSDPVEPLDPSLLRLNAVERSLRSFRSDLDARIALWFQWMKGWRSKPRRRPRSDSREEILMHEPGIPLKGFDDRNTSYRPIDTVYSPY